MTNNTTFEIDSRIYTTNGNGYYYMNINGHKTRIKKAEFDEAYSEYIEMTSLEAEESLAIEEALEAVQEDEAQEKQKKTPRKRTPKNIGFRNTYDNHEVILTEKQVDFIHHLPDTCYWDRGLDSGIWIDCLCDEIGGQFADKPMTVGAMISTLCEKGIGSRCKQRVNGKKCTSFALTELGKLVAKDLGL